MKGEKKWTRSLAADNKSVPAMLLGQQPEQVQVQTLLFPSWVTNFNTYQVVRIEDIPKIPRRLLDVLLKKKKIVTKYCIEKKGSLSYFVQVNIQLHKFLPFCLLKSESLSFASALNWWFRICKKYGPKFISGINSVTSLTWEINITDLNIFMFKDASMVLSVCVCMHSAKIYLY